MRAPGMARLVTYGQVCKLGPSLVTEVMTNFHDCRATSWGLE